MKKVGPLPNENISHILYNRSDELCQKLVLYAPQH
jgi:hypothetical protein